MEESPILSLARQITADAEILDSYLKENDLAIPGLSSDSPSDFPDLPPEIQESRRRIQRNSSKLQWLARGPVETIRWATWGVSLSLHEAPYKTPSERIPANSNRSS